MDQGVNHDWRTGSVRSGFSTEHREFGFVHRPVEGAVYLCPVFFRHKAEKIAMLMELHQNVVMGAVDGCSQRLVGQSKCLAAFELAQLDVGDDERFKSIETVWRCRVGNFVNPDDEVAEIQMQVFIVKPLSELLKGGSIILFFKLAHRDRTSLSLACQPLSVAKLMIWYDISKYFYVIFWGG